MHNHIFSYLNGISCTVGINWCEQSFTVGTYLLVENLLKQTDNYGNLLVWLREAYHITFSTNPFFVHFFFFDDLVLTFTQ